MGVSRLVGNLVVQRDNGQCVVQATHKGQARPGEQIHHRRPRGMGGTRSVWVNMPANLVYVCLACHMWIESNRYDAVEHGWIIQGTAKAQEVPIFYRGAWHNLDDIGRANIPASSST